MNRKRCGLLVAVASLVAATTISAGGWAVITVDALPEYIRAGEPFTLAYTVRQHGARLVGGLHGRVEARAGMLQVVADARPGKHEGHYVAMLSVPKPGDWSLTIQSGFGGHGTLALLPLSAVERAARPAPLHPSGRGRQLFLAKGCATCHRIEGKALPAGPHGPPLLPHKFQAEYLAGILANPALLPPSANYAFRMPNLGLDPREIGALVAFINDRSSDATTGAQRPQATER
jgi:mono/diheme cytochrome c family protein